MPFRDNALRLIKLRQQHQQHQKHHHQQQLRQQHEQVERRGEGDVRRIVRFASIPSVVPILLCVFLLGVGSAEAQPAPDAGLWTALFAQGDFSGHEEEGSPWRWAFDGQARFLEDTNGFNQSLLRPVIGRSLGSAWTVWLGYAWIRTNPGPGPESDEHRPFQQLTWSGSFGSLSASSRTRLEQRFVRGNNDLAWRFRQFVKLGYPLGLGTDLRLVGYEELFLNLNDADTGPRSGFDQNRFFAGVAIPVGGSTDATLELGYLNQFVRSPNSRDRLNHVLSLNLFLNF